MSFFVRQRWVDNRLNYTPTLNMSRLELDTKRMSNVWVPDLFLCKRKESRRPSRHSSKQTHAHLPRWARCLQYEVIVVII